MTRLPAILAAVLAGALLLAGCGPAPRRVVRTPGYLVGAYYYLWYPQNFRQQGWLRDLLVPRQEPALGVYSSRNLQVIEQHISWCSRAGIDFLALDWWPRHPQRNRLVSEVFLRASNLGAIRFCIFYETQDLGFDPELGITLLTPERIDFLVEDVTSLARRFFDHPRYLRLDGRPVIFFYLTRSLYVNYRQAFSRLRAALRQAGYDPFIVGDEIFWRVIVAEGEWDPAQGPPPRPRDSDRPQRDRLRLFDAITSYNLYDGRNLSHAGYGAYSRHLDDVETLYRRYRRACGDQVALVPNVMPGYNDRGVRLDVDHYAIPRQWRPGAPEGSFFAQALERVAKPYADPNLNLIMITSFNEWNEDTSIEPLKIAPPTRRDRSPSGRAYTQGYAYAGYGTTYLRVLRDRLQAVGGLVRDVQGRPAAGIQVAAWQKGRLLTWDTTDSYGRYFLSRRHLPPGEYQIGLKDSGPRRRVQVLPDRCRTGVDFRLPPQRP